MPEVLLGEILGNQIGKNAIFHVKKVFISNNNRISKEIFYGPSLFLLLLIYLNQYNRRKKIMRKENET